MDMDCSQKDLVSIIYHIFCILAIIFGFIKFFLRLEFKPRIQFDVDLKIVEKLTNGSIVEIIFYIENKGFGRHYIDVKNFNFSLRYIGSSLEEKNLVNKVSIKKEKMILLHFPEKFESQKIKMLPNTFEKTFIDPNVRQKYSHTLFLDNEINIVLLTGYFKYKDLSMDFHTAQGVFKIN